MNEKVVAFEKLNHRLIYAVAFSDGLVKIGVTKEFSRREKALSNTEHGKITKCFKTERCVNSFEIEKVVHEKMRKYNYFGEWYKIDFDYAVSIIKELFSSLTVFEKAEKNNKSTKYECDTLLDYFHRNEVEII